MLGFEINDQSRKEQREFYENRAKKGIAAPGEAADVFNMVEGYNDAARYEHLANDLSRRGWETLSGKSVESAPQTASAD
jgi:membrane dipeptidase